MRPNPPLEAMKAQEAMREGCLAELRRPLETKIEMIKDLLSQIFQGEKFTIAADGAVEHESGDLEMDSIDLVIIKEKEEELKDIYKQLKEIK